MLRRSFACTALVAAAALAVAADAPSRPAGSRVKLAVLVVFDQMGANTFTRWADLYGDGGFRRLTTDGVSFTHCHYPYASTLTGPGHASMLTGCSPDRHGIIMNDWYDREAGQLVSCSADPRQTNVYSVPRPPSKYPKDDATEKKYGGGSPHRLLAPTLADSLKAAYPAARTVGVSLKDRSALLPTGKAGNAAYWFDTRTGTFCTSTHYRDRPAEWVNSFNASKAADRWFGQLWMRGRTDVDYTTRAGPDDVAAEGVGVEKKQGRTFPHAMNGGLSAPGTSYYDTVTMSPFGNELLLDFARAAIDAEQLGKRDVPDLLTVSFSSNDLIGHMYGPDSQEVLDVTLRADGIVKGLLATLDRQVGAGNYALCLTADHGVCRMPENAARDGSVAKRIDGKELVLKAEQFLSKKYGVQPSEKGSWFESSSPHWLYLNRSWLKARGIDRGEAADALAGYLRAVSTLQFAYSAGDIAAGRVDKADPMRARFLKSYHPERCGDVGVVVKPYHMVIGYNYGTTHGSPHPYDTHVPLLAFGPGVKGGASDEPVTPQACAALLANWLGVPPPAMAEAPLPARVREAAP